MSLQRQRWPVLGETLTATGRWLSRWRRWTLKKILSADHYPSVYLLVLWTADIYLKYLPQWSRRQQAPQLLTLPGHWKLLSGWMLQHCRQYRQCSQSCEEETVLYPSSSLLFQIFLQWFLICLFWCLSWKYCITEGGPWLDNAWLGCN